MNEISEFIEVDRLTSAMLDGTISQDDFARLDKMLFKDADKRARYLEIVRMESLLHWEAVDSGSNLTLSHENAKIISFPALQLQAQLRQSSWQWLDLGGHSIIFWLTKHFPVK